MLLVSVFRLGTAVACGRRFGRDRGDRVVVRRVRVQRRMRSRGLLEVQAGGAITYVPVYFHTGLLAIAPDAPARIVRLGRWAACEIGDGVIALPVGRERSERPQGTVLDAPRLNPADLRARSERFGSIRRRLVLDAPAAVGAPVIGLLWVLVAGGGVVDFIAVTVLAAIVAIWTSAIGGSDPS
ncbi:hypothetical protein OG579_08770 [Williamsia herbipolensis]|uniref:Uncharacterized protein n=1 Tax=Williamsia herbipolensis TaxID=1603258 RepID=A0AAU4K718_9NOCA|nr:hypothetical protein [Williamsia herbipolensis]